MTLVNKIEGIEAGSQKTIPIEFHRWCAGIEQDVRVLELKHAEILTLIAALRAQAGEASLEKK